MVKDENLISEKKWLHMLCIAAAVLLVFGNSLSFDFVWDDRPLILGIDTYKDFDLKKMLSAPGNGLEYLPVRDISYGIDYLLWGENPAGFHFSNVFFYFLNTLAVYFMTIEITSLLFSEGMKHSGVHLNMIALFTALFFAVHPLHSEPVSFIIGRNVLLSGLFFFLSCCFFLRFISSESGEGRKFYAVSLICFVLSLFSKATSIILPLIFLVFMAVKKMDIKKIVFLLMPYFIIALSAFLLFKNIASETKMIVSDHTMVFGAFSFASKLAVSLQIPFFYIMKLLLPVGLSAEYTAGFSRSFVNAAVISSLAGLVLIMFYGFIKRKRYPEILFSFLWFLAALLPVMNFFLTHPVVADRYVYLSSFAFFYFITVRVFRASGNAHVKRAIMIMAVVILAFSVMTAQRNRVWKDEKALWTDTMSTSPESFKPYVNLGTLYFNEGEYDKAFGLFKKLQELDPSSVTLDYYRGLQLFNSGKYAAAINLLNAALANNNESLEVNYLLGRSYEITGSIDKAMQSYMNMLKSNEIDTAGRKDFARARLAELRVSKSAELEAMRNSVRDNPADLNARIRLAIALDRTGMFDEALKNYKKLEEIGGDNWVLFYNMANIYKKTENYEEAAVYYRKSIAMNNKNADAYNNLGLAMKKLKRHDRAIKAFEDAIRADKSFAYAPFNLAVMYFHLGKREKALKYFNYVQERFPHLKGRVFPYISRLND